MFLLTVVLPALLQATGLQATGQPAAPDHHLVSIKIKDARSLDKILALDLDIAACTALELPARQVEIIADDEAIRRISKAKLQYEIVIRNLEDTIEKRLAAYVTPYTLTPGIGKGAMGGHYTLAQMEAILDKFNTTNPAICAKKTSIGKSIEGRNIWMVKISDNVNKDEAEPEALFDAIHHAREPLSMSTTLLFMDWLIDGYGKDPLASYLVDNRELYFIPCLNPDGYEYNRRIRPGGGGMWRKNRRNNGGGIFGVDLNRNYTTGFGLNGGSSSNPRSQVYRGTSPFSEPETLAIENFIKSRNFTFGCTTHTYTEILLRPWGYQRSEPANANEYRIIDKEATKVTGMRAGPASILLYIASGVALDHYHQAHKMFGYTPELGTLAEGGFWPNPANSVNIANRHQHMFRTFALVAGASIAVSSVLVREGPGSNNNGKVEPGETGQVIVSVRNDGSSLPNTNVLANLSTQTRAVSISRSSTDFGKLARFSQSSNVALPLEFKIDKNFQGRFASLKLDVLFEGRKIETLINLAFVDPVIVLQEDFEKDTGFARSSNDTATTGRFERAAPQQTTYQNRIYQPGSDHTKAPGSLCWVTDALAGSSVGSRDVDGGKTSFLSPLIDLRHVNAATLELWLYYSESVTPGDPFRIESSSDAGQSWKTLYNDSRSTNGWTKLRLELQGPMTDKMQFRFTAKDDSASLVEALIDDLSISGIVDSAALSILGSGRRNSTLRLGFNGKRNGLALLLLATATAKLIIPGIQGTLLVDPAKTFFSPALPYGNKDRLSLDILVPNDPRLVTQKFYCQQLLIDGSELSLGNRTFFVVR